MDIQSKMKGDCLIVRVEAESVDYTNCDELKQTLIGFISTKKFKSLLINLKDVSFMDSMTIGTLVGIKNALVEKDKKLALCNVHPYVLKIIGVVTLGAIFVTYETQTDALKEMAQG